MDIAETFLKWIDQWIVDAQNLTADLNSCIKNSDLETGNKSGVFWGIELELKAHLDQVYESLCLFHQNSIDFEKEYPQIRSAREVIFAGIDIMGRIKMNYSGYENDLVLGLQKYLLSIRSTINGQWETPTSSILFMKLGIIITKYLFYHNGIATIGQLQKALDSREKLHMIGASRMEKIRIKVDKRRARQILNSTPITEKPLDLQSSSYGVWTVMVKERPEFFIELNGAQVLTVASHCPIHILPDGKVLAKLANI
jgi:hypothetical protein